MDKLMGMKKEETIKEFKKMTVTIRVDGNEKI